MRLAGKGNGDGCVFAMTSFYTEGDGLTAWLNEKVLVGACQVCYDVEKEMMHD